ncbi:MAG: lysylphosphatidylglycerol synthase transmembrane domain-containing protein [Chloroflexota bacterium]
MGNSWARRVPAKLLVRWLAGLLLSAIFLWAVLRGINLGRVGSILAGANRELAIPALLAFMASVAARSWRWLLCFEEDDPLAFPDSLMAYSLGSVSAFVIPARLGDLVRVYAVGYTSPVSRARALGTLVVERLSDLFAVVLLVSAMLPLFHLPGWVISADVVAAILCVCALVVVYWLARQRERLSLPEWVLRRRLLEPGGRLFLRLLDGFGAVKDARRGAAIVALAFLVWLLTVTSYVASFRALSIPLGWREGALLTGVLALVAIVPAGPGYAGSFELAAVALLGLFKVDSSVAVAYIEYTRIISLISLAIMTLLGALATRLRRQMPRPAPAAAGEPGLDDAVPGAFDSGAGGQ